jgi:hypothetical protein
VSEIVLIKDAVIQTSNHVSREQVMQLESAMKELPDHIEPDECTVHHFADGVYLRELFMAAGTVVVGKIHRTKHLTIICNGTVRITTDDGVKEVTGPAVFASDAGAKKAVYAITDATLMNPHPSEETDLAKLEEQFIAPSFEALEHGTKALEQELDK